MKYVKKYNIYAQVATRWRVMSEQITKSYYETWGELPP